MGKYRDVLGQVLRLALIVAVCVADRKSVV